jgi:hypothetical protein
MTSVGLAPLGPIASVAPLQYRLLWADPGQSVLGLVHLALSVLMR